MSSQPNLHLDDLSVPELHIRTDGDVETWKRTSGYKNYLQFLHLLADSVVGVELGADLNSDRFPGVKATIDLLDQLEIWVDQIPLQSSPQRFGNLAFRDWGKRLEKEAGSLLCNFLPSHLQDVARFLKPYLMTSFGSFGRIDYGTGHETSFALLLFCLYSLGFYEDTLPGKQSLVLVVFTRYLQLTWRLQDVYRLEPAGSHGVWGLDDYSFLGYLFGSAQLRETHIPPSIVLQLPLPSTNLYYLSINRVRTVKRGPFHEHSPQLHSIAVGVPHWKKVSIGMFKMYQAEVLGKRVVVQHLPLGGLVPWDPDGLLPSRR